MEKLMHLLWRGEDHDEVRHRDDLLGSIAPRIVTEVDGLSYLDVMTGDTSADMPNPTILLGRGPELASVVTVWIRCLDDREPIVACLSTAAGTTGRVDQYLVTESVPQPRERTWPDGERTPGMTHFSWFPKPDRLTDEEFFHGWHDIHTPSTPALHPYRVEYERNSVARVLTPGSPPVRALVAERWQKVEEYLDPARLFSSQAAIDESVAQLPLYADLETLSSRPLHQTIVVSSS